MNMSQTVRWLGENDPIRKVVYIRLWQERDAPLAQALERNEYINDIHFIVEMVPQMEQPQEEHWDNLLRVLATQEKLEKVEIDGYGPGRPPITVEHATILQAVQQNPSIGSVTFAGCNLTSGEVISSFLDTATSLRQFYLRTCSMTGEGAGRIAASLQCNTSLRTLTLLDLEDSHFTVILQGLETNASLQSLSLYHFYHTLGQAVPLAVQHLLERTSSIQSLELNDQSFKEESFRPICQALIHSTTVSKVQFNWFHFSDAGSVDLFRQLLQTKPNLQLLRIRYCSFFENSRALVGASLQAVLLQPISMLRSLEFMHFELNALFPGPTFGALLRAVGRSGLECFKTGHIRTEEQFQSLLSNIPVMKIRKLEFDLDLLVRDGENRKQALLQAVKQNFSLRSLNATFDGHPFFTDDDNLRFQFYFDRNERLAQWVANRDTIPCLLWPEAVGLAMEAGEDTLYRSLQAVLGDEVESAVATRKAGKRK